MLPDRVSNPGPLTYESGALPIALRGPAYRLKSGIIFYIEADFKIRTLSFKTFVLSFSIYIYMRC